jgi:predicted permease
MDGVGGVRPESFDFYEGIRIVIPGGFAAGLLLASFGTVDFVAGLAIASSGFALVGLVLALGLVLYFLDLPYKSAVYSSHQPTELLAAWYKKPEREVVSLYFHLLDTELPSLIRSRALYMGSIFRIGFETVLLVALAQLGWWSFDALSSDQTWRPESRVQWVAIGLVVAILILRLLTTVVREAPQEAGALSPRTAWRGLGLAGSRILADLGPVRLALVLLAVGITLSQISERNWITRLAAVVACDGIALVWLYSFFWGRVDKEKGVRVPLNVLTQSLLLGVPTAGLMAVSGIRNAHGFDTFTEIAGWAAAAVVSIALVAGRGHERRLRGGYTSQRAWLELNAQNLRRRFRPDETKELGFREVVTRTRR